MADAGRADGLEELLAACPTPPAPAVRAAIERLRLAGGRVFEAVIGTAPGQGVRLTWRPTEPGGAGALAAAAGLADHPWGMPDWIGLRTAPDGAVRCKAYHRRPPPLGVTQAHRGLLPECHPVMAALEGDVQEVYAMLPAELEWKRFAARALAPLPGVVAERTDFRPQPRSRAHGFAMSARHRGPHLEAITLYVFNRSLPDGETVVAEWGAALDSDQHAVYAAAVGALTRCGQPLADLHGLLAWSFDMSGTQSRAASLQVPDHLSA